MSKLLIRNTHQREFNSSRTFRSVGLMAALSTGHVLVVWLATRLYKQNRMRAHTEAPVEGPRVHSYISYISTPRLPLPRTDLHQTPYYRAVEG